MKKYIYLIYLLGGVLLAENRLIAEDAKNNTLPWKKFTFEMVQRSDISNKGFDRHLVMFMWPWEKKGSTWTGWEKLLTECMKSEWLKDPVYLGVTNTIGLGSITDEDRKSLRRIMDNSTFTNEEKGRLINKGATGTCGYTQEFSVNISAALNSSLRIGNSELEAAIRDSKNTNISISAWEIDNLITDSLADLLNETNNPGKLAYKKSLLAKGRLILVKVIRVQGFVADVKINNNASATLKAALDKGVVANVGNTGIQLQFELKDDSTIRVKSSGDFLVFGEFMRGKEV